MTTLNTTAQARGVEPVRARKAGFVSDVLAISSRTLRQVPREPETAIPPVFIAIFFFLVNIATLATITEANIPGFDYNAFMMATAVLLGVTGISRAPAFVLDIANGYFDRLLVSPASRLAILIGHLLTDVVVAAAITVPIVGLGLALGVEFESGPLGVLVFILLAALWSLAFAGFSYAVALKTGNPAAVNSMFLLFFPFLFMTSSYVPQDQLSGWLDAVATVNPVTYLLDGLRSLTSEGWNATDLAQAALAVAVIGFLSLSMCLATLRGRVKAD